MQSQTASPFAVWPRALLVVAAATALALPAVAQNDVTPQGHLQQMFPASRQPGAPARPMPPKPSAASTLPPTPPTPAVVTPPQPPPPPPTPAQQSATPAVVTYADGKLTIQADNSSLNQILGVLMRDTGLQITGGVTDSRVYGTYGPAPLLPILTTLLEGTGSNMVFTPGSHGKPAQLTLSARDGGATPPPPTVAPPDHLQPMAPVVATTPAPAQPATPSAATPPSSTPAPALANTPAAAPAPATPAQPAAATNPNQVKSPEQILQEILQMRQQKNNAAPAPATPSPAPAAPATH